MNFNAGSYLMTAVKLEASICRIFFLWHSGWYQCLVGHAFPIVRTGGMCKNLDRVHLFKLWRSAVENQLKEILSVTMTYLCFVQSVGFAVPHYHFMWLLLHFLPRVSVGSLCHRRLHWCLLCVPHLLALSSVEFCENFDED